MKRDLLTRPSFLSSVPAVAGQWFDYLTAPELSLKYLCFGHQMVDCAVLPSNCDVVALTDRGIDLSHQEGTS